MAVLDSTDNRRAASATALRDGQHGPEENTAGMVHPVGPAVKDRRHSRELLDRLLWGVNLQREGPDGDENDGDFGVEPDLDRCWDAADYVLDDVADRPELPRRESGGITRAPMKAQRRFGLDLSWLRINLVFGVDVGLFLLLTRCWPQAWQHAVPAWWVGAALAVVTTLAGIVTYREITMASEMAAWLCTLFADPEESLTAACKPAVDHRRRFSSDVIGVREYRGQLAAVIAVDAAADERSGRHHRPVTESRATLPVQEIAAGLRQFDVRLEGIDIVSVRTRLVSDGANGPAPQGVEPAIGARIDQLSTWLILRMDPQRNLGGVAVRDSVASTLAAAVERLAHRIDGSQCAARPLTADEFAELDSAVLAGLQPGRHRPSWRHLKHFNGYVTSFWVSPPDIISETLARLMLPEADATVLTIRLKTRGDQPEVSAWVRYHTGSPLPRQLWNGLNRLVGRQLAAVQASLPVPLRRPPMAVPARLLADDEDLTVPLGQLSKQTLRADQRSRRAVNDFARSASS